MVDGTEVTSRTTEVERVVVIWVVLVSGARDSAVVVEDSEDLGGSGELESEGSELIDVVSETVEDSGSVEIIEDSEFGDDDTVVP